ncbi:AmmeMemoRadiSam system radical SAM enzyme [bacterium]|nr:AmmeMemoRadiSam system radical SAM enzyme [bacterium]
MDQVTRRQFMSSSVMVAGGMLCPMKNIAAPSWNTEARYYEKLPDHQIRCTLCPWQCVVKPGERGNCEVRANRKGTYYSLVYGQVAAHHKDPIEKKPLFHFLPGSTAFSIATAGCNVECKFCQNADLAQRRPEELRTASFSPEDVVKYAKQTGCQSIAYTYNEPVIFTEYMQDIAVIGQEQGIRSVVISNGFINQKPLKDLCRVIDSYKVDLKAFTEDYYQKIVNARLKPVLDTLVTLKAENIWTEIVYLVVPTLNDDEKSLSEMVKWIYQELGPDVPLHFSRFYPKYKLLSLPPTPVATLEKAYQIGLDAGLHHVYLGNVPGHQGENTLCPSCGETLIRRVGYQIYENHIQSGKCQFCNHSVAGIWG